MNLNQISHANMDSNRMKVQWGSRQINNTLPDSASIDERIEDIRLDILQLSDEINIPATGRDTRYRGRLFLDWTIVLTKVKFLHASISQNDPITNEHHRAFADLKAGLQLIHDRNARTYAEILPIFRADSSIPDSEWNPAAVIPDLPNRLEYEISEIRKDITRLSNKINRPTRESRVQGTLFSDWRNLVMKIGALRVSISKEEAAMSSNENPRHLYAALYNQDIANQLLPVATDSEARFDWSPTATVPNLPRPPFSFARRFNYI